MDRSITIRIRDVYGNRLYYPACDIAELFTRLTGTKTLSLTDIETIKKLGYRIAVAPEEL